MRSDAGEGGSRSRWIGRVLRDRWRIDARISRGGVGTVYAATHKNNGSRAAIKVLHPQFARDPDTRGRFLQEGYAANQVNHPGVVRILDDDTTEDGHAYLVMELLEGEVLERRRERKGGRLPLADVYEVGEQLLDVLAAAHEKGIVHRDIKPENLFVTHGGRLKVLDFGFAQMKSGFRTEQTATGFLLGTPGFMSPEQAVGNRHQIDAQTDIWAAGATLFTLISGEPVHAGSSAAEMLVAAANYQARSLATVTTGLSRHLVDVIDRAVAFDKADRWPNARAMQLALRAATSAPISGHVSRRSIPDDAMSFVDAEELDESDLTSASWPAPASPSSGNAENTHPEGIERTLAVDVSARFQTAPIPSSITRPNAPLAAPHPAENEGPTIARPPQSYDVPASLVPPSSEPGGDGGTLIMEVARAAPFAPAPPMPPVSAAPTTEPKPFGQQSAPRSHAIASPRAFPASDPNVVSNDGPPAMRGEELMQTGRVTRGPHRKSGSAAGQVLVFVGVALVTMVVVIVTGLLVLAATD